jgi:hypothetical protein
MAYEGGGLRPQPVLPRLVVHHLVPSGFSPQVELPRAVHDFRAGILGRVPLAEVRHGAVLSEPKRELTPAVLYELFERHSQCVFDQSGKCPLLVFTQQMCWEINEFFNGKENEDTGRRGRNLPTSTAEEELE